jgi:putative membrane protein
MMSFKQGLTTLFVFFMLITWIYPPHPWEQLMHSSLTFVGAYVIWRLNKKCDMSNSDFTLIVLFLILHTIGARWLYSYVPYNDWVRFLSGINLNELFGLSRNHHDRIIHFLYGVLLTPPIVSQLGCRYKTKKVNLFVITLGIIIVSSVIYEWAEWLVAIGLSPADAEAYNGQQGDIWDPHKDMLLAMAGSLVWYFKYKKQ